MKEETKGYYLTEEEVLLLDGKVNEKVQKEIDKIDTRRSVEEGISDEVPDEFRSFVAEVVQHARDNGQLVWRHQRISKCKVCGEDPGYAKYTRNSKYHRKGDLNYNQRLYIRGIELADSVISVKGSVWLGCCSKCMEKIKPYLAEVLCDVEAQVSKKITGESPKWKRYVLRRCKKCGWEGSEGKMGLLSALMGGKYPGKCPKCGVEQIPFGERVFEIVKGFEVVAVSEDLSE